MTTINIQKLFMATLDRPIAYHRIFRTISGSTVAGLFLSQAWYWKDKGKSGDGWFYKTQSEWLEETGLSRYEQETARKQLCSKNLISEQRRGVPARIYYRVNIDEIAKSILETVESQIDGSSQTVKPNESQIDGSPHASKRQTNRGKAPICCDGSAQSFIYTEITSENTFIEQPENFSEQPEEPKPSPVNQPPIVEASNPTTAKEKTTPQPPSAALPLTAQIMAAYAKFRPAMWVDTPTRTPALEAAFFRVLQNLPEPSELVPRIELALKFAQDDFALSKKTGTIDDLFKFNNLVEWSDKGRALEQSKPVAVPQEELDRRQKELQRQIRISQAKNEAKRNWIDIHYPESDRKLLGERQWNRLSDEDKKNVETIYFQRLELVNAKRRREANTQNPPATIQERRELATA